MNESVREYAKTYIAPPVIVNLTFWAALEAWGLTEGLTKNE